MHIIVNSYITLLSRFNFNRLLLIVIHVLILILQLQVQLRVRLLCCYQGLLTCMQDACYMLLLELRLFVRRPSIV